MNENLPIEGVDVGASTTESDGFSAKVGVGDCVREVFGQSGAVTLQEQSEILGDLLRKI